MESRSEHNRYSQSDIENTVNLLHSVLAIPKNHTIQEEFEAGLHPELLAYKNEASTLPVIQKYLVGATTFYHQPCQFYDIFRVCRCVNMVQFLALAIPDLLAKKVAGVTDRLDRLVNETEEDAFDSVAFEIISAAKYLHHEETLHLEFIEETPSHATPDFIVQNRIGESFVECKKLARTQVFSHSVRDQARELLNPVLLKCRYDGVCVSGNITFHVDPHRLEADDVLNAFDSALRNGVTIIGRDFTVSATRLGKFESDDYILYPSPAFSWARYEYKVRSNWIGIVHHLLGNFAQKADLPTKPQGGRSTWLNSVQWDGGIKWRISSDQLIDKYRRFAFNTVFKGLTQVHGRGLNSTVHVWLESDYHLGGRSKALFDLFQRIARNQMDIFGWLIINEILFDVSPKGFFDIIEHAHSIRGPTAVGPQPMISGVLLPEDASTKAKGTFGTGAILPDIDDL